MISRIVAASTLTCLVVSACGGSPAMEPAAPTATVEADSGSTAPVDAGATDASQETAIAKPPAASEPASPKERLMQVHSKETARMRSGVINGVLSEAVRPASTLANLEGLESFPKNWQPSLKALENAYLRMKASTDIPGAAAATADIGVACGNCHKTLGGPKASSEPAPAAGTTVASRMQRHVWATERLWEALYVPSDASWKAGVEALAGEPFPKELLDKGGVHAKSAASRFTSIVATAAGKQKPEDRAKVYASMLETCSACHMATRGGPSK